MINTNSHNHQTYMVSLNSIELELHNLKLVLEDLELAALKTLDLITLGVILEILKTKIQAFEEVELMLIDKVLNLIFMGYHN